MFRSSTSYNGKKSVGLIMLIKNKKIVTCVMVVLLFFSMLVVAKETADFVVSERLLTDKSTPVVIDAGHGAEDSGKVGIGGVLEKDINLSIALRLKELLQQQDIRVVMTREDDKGTFPNTGSNRKVRDMQNRVERINKERPALVISIHQNSFPDESVSGAQTFYFEGSEEGKRAAEILQKQLIATLQPKKERVAKANSSYYLLKNTEYPITIVECGFLTNRQETKKLCDEEYQEQIAWAIHLGVLQYLNTGGTVTNEMDENTNQNNN